MNFILQTCMCKNQSKTNKKWLFELQLLSHQSERKFKLNHYLFFPYLSTRVVRRSEGSEKIGVPHRSIVYTGQDCYTHCSLSLLWWLCNFCVLCSYGNLCQSREPRYLGSYPRWSQYLPGCWVGIGPCCFK